MDVTELSFAPGEIAPAMEGYIVYGGRMPLNISERLWALMWEEFKCNGKKMLTPGKVRFLRRQVRKHQAARRVHKLILEV